MRRGEQARHWQTITIMIVLTLFCDVTAMAQDGRDSGFRPLLNGRDLTGWVLVNTPAETWTVKDDLLICSGKPIGEIRTEQMYQNFILEVEWRHLVPGGNAGIFVWADDITARGVPFHRSVEVQVLENAYGQSQGHTTHGDIFPIHGAKLTPLNGRGGNRAFPVEERSLPSPQWNHYRIECRDGEIALAVNGKVVTRGREASPRKGYLCLESEGGVVHYRNLKIQELPETPIDAEHIAVANRGFVSLYSGLDLRGWTIAPASGSHWISEDWVLRFDGGTPEGLSEVVHEAAFDHPGFLMDIQPEADFRELVLNTGDPENLIRLSMDDPELKGLLQSGQWTRLEWEQRDGNWVITVDGKALQKRVPVSVGKLAMSFIIRGPARFANLYGRSANGK